MWSKRFLRLFGCLQMERTYFIYSYFCFNLRVTLTSFINTVSPAELNMTYNYGFGLKVKSLQMSSELDVMPSDTYKYQTFEFVSYCIPELKIISFSSNIFYECSFLLRS